MDWKPPLKRFDRKLVRLQKQSAKQTWSAINEFGFSMDKGSGKKLASSIGKLTIITAANAVIRISIWGYKTVRFFYRLIKSRP